MASLLSPSWHGLLCRWHSTRLVATTPSAAACATGGVGAGDGGAHGRSLPVTAW